MTWTEERNQTLFIINIYKDGEVTGQGEGGQNVNALSSKVISTLLQTQVAA